MASFLTAQHTKGNEMVEINPPVAIPILTVEEE
jgi:hypothetical protein